MCCRLFQNLIFFKLTSKELKTLKCNERQIAFLLYNLHSKHRLLYLKTQSVPRSKHYSSYTKHILLYLKTQSVQRSKHYSS
jgi:hypothetical protein